MTTLKLINDSPPYIFESLGKRNDMEPGNIVDNKFPKDKLYVLRDGKFPLTDYKDMFSKSNLYHRLDVIDNNIKVKITGFDNSCQEGQINKYGSCKITVEKEATTGGRKNKSNRRKTNRRKTNRRKSNRRKTNRRKSNRRKTNRRR